MKLIFIANSSFYLKNFRANTIKYFCAQGFHVECWVPDTEYEDVLNDLGANTKVLNNPKLKLIWLKYILIFYQYIILLRKTPVDSLVFTFTPVSNVLIALSRFIIRARVVLVCNISGQGKAALSNILVRNFVGFLLRFSITQSSFTFYQNDQDYKTFKHLKEENSQMLLAGSGICLTEFPFLNKNVENKQLVVGMFSRIIPEKGVLEYLKSSMRLSGDSGFKFVLAGAYSDKAINNMSKIEFEKYCRSQNVEFLGFLKDVRPMLQTLDVFVLPSRYPEGTPRSLIEALSTGIPIITTDSPGCRDCVVDSWNGFLIRESHEWQITNALKKFKTKESHEISEMRENSRKLAEATFSEEVNIRNYAEVAKRFLN